MKFLVIYSESAGLNLPIMYYIPNIKLPPIVSTMKTLLLVPCADCRILKNNICHHHCTFLLFLMWCVPVAYLCDFIQGRITSNREVCACQQIQQVNLGHFAQTHSTVHLMY